MSNETNPAVPAAVVAEEPVPNRFTPDALDRVARLRALAEDFPDEKDPRALTRAEIQLARRTTPAALEKAALFAEAAPGIGSVVANVNDLREAIAFEMAYGGVRDAALAVVRRVDHAILRRKLNAVRTARGLYRVAKGYVTLDAGDPARPHLEEMKRALVPARRRKAADPNAARK